MILVSNGNYLVESVHSLLDDVLVEVCFVENPLAGFQPHKYSLGSLQHSQEPAQDAHPGAKRSRVSPNILIEDEEQFLLQAIGCGFVVFLVPPLVGSNRRDDLLWQRHSWLDDELLDGFGKLLKGSATGGSVNQSAVQSPRAEC